MSERLLVIDDDEHVRGSYVAHFSRAGFDVLCASSLSEAAARLGVDAFLHKPVSLVWLESLLRTRIDDRRRGPATEAMFAAG